MVCQTCMRNLHFCLYLILLKCHVLLHMQIEKTVYGENILTLLMVFHTMLVVFLRKDDMAIVAKWLTHRIVAPAFVSSILIGRPTY